MAIFLLTISTEVIKYSPLKWHSASTVKPYFRLKKINSCSESTSPSYLLISSVFGTSISPAAYFEHRFIKFFTYSNWFFLHTSSLFLTSLSVPHHSSLYFAWNYFTRQWTYLPYFWWLFHNLIQLHELSPALE